MKTFKITKKGFLKFTAAALTVYTLIVIYLLYFTPNAHLTPAERAVPMAPLKGDQSSTSLYDAFYAMEEWQWDFLHKFCKGKSCGLTIDPCTIDEDTSCCDIASRAHNPKGVHL